MRLASLRRSRSGRAERIWSSTFGAADRTEEKEVEEEEEEEELAEAVAGFDADEEAEEDDEEATEGGRFVLDSDLSDTPLDGCALKRIASSNLCVKRK